MHTVATLTFTEGVWDGREQTTISTSTIDLIQNLDFYCFVASVEETQSHLYAAIGSGTVLP
jgi:hypothetical protein